MKHTFFFLMTALALFLVVQTAAGQDTGPAHGPGFVDENGDGVNDNAADYDQDGVPNGQDPDYERQSHSGESQGRGAQRGQGFVDMDGDGLNDRALDADGDGIPNGRDDDYVRPEDGSGSQNQHGRQDRWNGPERQSERDGSMDGMGSENRTGEPGQRRGHGKK